MSENNARLVHHRRGDGSPLLALSFDDTDISRIFEDARRKIDEQEENIRRIAQFEEEIAQAQDLFDAEDVGKVNLVLEARRQDLAVLSGRFKNAMTLYQKTVSDLDAKVSRRQQVLEHIDETLGAVSSEPLLLEYFGKKQAMFATSLLDTRKVLCQKICSILAMPLPTHKK